MTPHLAHIRRHPIKSIGGEGLDRVALTAGARLPGDRAWAVLSAAGERLATARTPGEWLPKSAFLVTAKSHALQAVQGGWSGAHLVLRHPDQGEITVDPDGDQAALLTWLAPLWPADRGAPSRLLRAEDSFTDDRRPFVSILSLDSLAQLEADLGQRLDMERWRGNLWLKGLPPFAEFDLIGQTIQIGPARLRIEERTGRCPATSGNAATGRPDCDMLAALERLYGHTDFGVFATVNQGGEIATDDEVRL